MEFIALSSSERMVLGISGLIIFSPLLPFQELFQHGAG